MQQQPQQSSDITTVLMYRITTLEKDMQLLQTELRTYVPQRENDLQLKIIQDTVHRIEGDVQDIRKRLENQGQKTNDIQFGALKWVLSVGVSILVGVLIAVLAHIILHPGG